MIKNFKDRDKKKRIPINIPADFSAETLQARKEWNDIVKALKNENCQPRIFILAKFPFRCGDIKAFLDTQKLKEFVAWALGARPAFQEMLKGVHTEKQREQYTKR